MTSSLSVQKILAQLPSQCSNGLHAFSSIPEEERFVLGCCGTCGQKLRLPLVCLLLVKEEGDRNQTLSTLVNDPHLILDPENFSLEIFSQEIETLPFLSKTKICVVKDLDQMKADDLKVILSYVKQPNPWISLFLTAATLPAPKVKSFQERGVILTSESEKPWEKEKRLADWLIHEAAKEGVALPITTAQTLVKLVNPSLLKQELKKLICYVGDQGKITLEDIRSISSPIHHETLWQLGEAIFHLDASQTIQIGKILFEEGMAIFPLIAHLRSQFNTAIQTLEAFREGGKQAVSKAFPYLKGGLLDKKLKLCQNYGIERLNRGLIHIFEIELKAKNSSIDPDILLEILFSKLTNDTLSLTKSSWTC